jgi:hypothetical protein
MSSVFAAAPLHVLGTFPNVGMTDSLFILAVSIGLTAMLFPALLVSSFFYFAIFRRRTPRNGALWCAGVHTAAHIAMKMSFAEPVTIHLAVPLLAAGLWGLWLPRIEGPALRWQKIRE